MVKENTGTSENLVGFTIIGDLPKSGRFCDGIGASGPERAFFGSGFVSQVTEALA